MVMSCSQPMIEGYNDVMEDVTSQFLLGLNFLWTCLDQGEDVILERTNHVFKEFSPSAFPMEESYDPTAWKTIAETLYLETMVMLGSQWMTPISIPNSILSTIGWMEWT